MPSIPVFLNAKDIGRVLKIHPGTARRMLARGTFGPRLKSGRKWLIRLETFEAWAKAQEDLPRTPRSAQSLPSADPEIVALLQGQGSRGARRKGRRPPKHRQP